MRAGTTCYLGVNVEGAMFSIGDGHYRQGEGESCGTAVEGAMTTTLIVELIKGRAPGWPRLEDDEHIMTVGSSRPLEDAWRVSQVEMVGWLGELYGLQAMDAYQLLSQISETPLANVVDVNYSVADEGAQVTAARRLRLRRAAPRPARPRCRARPRVTSHLAPLPSRKGDRMDLQLTGRRALVTGGTRGIGRSIVETLRRRGCVGRLLRP